jgi:hypothetical protein
LFGQRNCAFGLGAVGQEPGGLPAHLSAGRHGHGTTLVRVLPHADMLDEPLWSND